MRRTRSRFGAAERSSHHAEHSRSGRESARPPAGRALDWDLAFLTRWTAPLMVVARAMFGTIFIAKGRGTIADYAGVVGYMQTNGVDPRLLPLVILTEP